MAKFKPQISFKTAESIHEYNTGWRKRPYDVKEYKTYRKLKQDLKNVLKENLVDYASVVRSKRGEWGEWFEHWTLVNGKPTIIKQGWN
jgi:hypothetical protein